MPKYDLVVVGAGLGGLAAAALASRMNKRTVVLEPGNAVGGALGSFQKKDFLFYPGPRLSFGFEPGGILQLLNESLGIAQSASLRSPCYQIALPDRRITVYAEQSEILEELRREFPNEIDKIAKFYRAIRKQSLRNSKSRLSTFLAGTKSARAFISSYRFSIEFRAFLDVQALYFFGNHAAALPQLSLIMLCASAPLTLPQGFRKLADQTLDVLIKNGGEIRYGVPLQSISFKRNALSISQETFETDAVLLNLEPGPQIPFTCFALREDVVPVGMLNEVLYVPDYAHPEHFLALSLSAKGDPTAAPSGMRALTVSSRFFGHQSLDDLIQHVKMIIPFLHEFLVFAQEYVPMMRTFVLPKDISMKKVKTSDNQALLSRNSGKGIYMLLDRVETPAQSVTAVRRFIEQVR